MNSTRPPSMQDVAEAAGVHRTTVSLALRDSPKLPLSTRQQVRAVAERLGYQANPLVAALMTSRVSRRQPAHQATLAFVSVAEEPPPDWERAEYSYAWMYRGAAARAEQRGYKLSPFWLGEPGMNAGRFMRAMTARNIHGLLIAPQMGSRHRIDLEWSRYSVVEFGYNLAEPVFHRVVHDYFHSMQTACGRAAAAGYQRLGFMLPQRADVKTHHLWSAAYLHFQQSLPKSRRLAIHLPEHLTTANVREWQRSEKPDIVMLGGHHYPERADAKASFVLPAGLPILSLDCRDREGTNPGIFQDWPVMGAAAADLLISQLQRSERGIPVQACSLLVSGLWRGDL